MCDPPIEIPGSSEFGMREDEIDRLTKENHQLADALSSLWWHHRTLSTPAEALDGISLAREIIAAREAE